jgi:hypothetical protein
MQEMNLQQEQRDPWDELDFDSNFEIILDSIKLNGECISRGMSSGPRSEDILTVIGNILDSNPILLTHNNSRLFHETCKSLRGILCISVLSLFLSKDRTPVKAI